MVCCRGVGGPAPAERPPGPASTRGTAIDHYRWPGPWLSPNVVSRKSRPKVLPGMPRRYSGARRARVGGQVVHDIGGRQPSKPVPPRLNQPSTWSLLRLVLTPTWTSPHMPRSPGAAQTDHLPVAEHLREVPIPESGPALVAPCQNRFFPKRNCNPLSAPAGRFTHHRIRSTPRMECWSCPDGAYHRC